MITPPLEVQDAFVDFKNQLEELTRCQKQSRKQIEALFHSLMNKAFRGELRNAS